MSTGIIYHYFEGKNELIDELYSAIKNKMARAMMQNFDANQPIVSQIQQFIQDVICYTVWHPNESAFIEQYDRSPYQHGETDSNVSQYYRAIMACFEQAKKERIIKDLPISVIYLFTIGIATSLGQKQANGQITLNEKLSSQVVETSWQAIRY